MLKRDTHGRGGRSCARGALVLPQKACTDHLQPQFRHCCNPVKKSLKVTAERDSWNFLLYLASTTTSQPQAIKMAEASPIAEVFTFPTDPALFNTDHRISWSRADNKYIAVQESDGTEFEFDAQLKRWVPLADEDEEALIQMQQSTYGHDPYEDAQSSNGRKRKQDDLEVSAHAGPVHLELSRIPLHLSCTMTGWAVQVHHTTYDQQ